MDPNQDPNNAPDENALDDLSQANVTAATPSIEQVLDEDRSKSIWHKIIGLVNIYLLLFLLVIVVVVVIFVVLYLNSRKEPDPQTTQELTQQTLNEIATGDARVGDPKYVLSIQSDAVFAGNALVRGDLSVAGAVQLGQGLSVSGLTVTGNGNIATLQANSLNVSGDAAVQGRLSAGGSLSIGGSANVGGTLTAAQITTGSLTLAGNGTLTINNHLNAAGPAPNRSNGSALGSGGSSSVSGSDLAGTIAINTGGSPSSGCFATVNFVQSYNGTPQVIVTPVGSVAGSLQYYVNRSSNNFSICSANAAPGGQSFAFDYFVIN